MQTFVTIIHVFTCVFLVLLVLLQSGKGAEISASFAGSSQTVFGTSGGANFFTKVTAVLAGVFMLTSLGLTIMGGKSKQSVFEGSVTAPSAVETGAAPAAPVAPGVPAPAAPQAPTDSTKK